MSFFKRNESGMVIVLILLDFISYKLPYLSNDELVQWDIYFIARFCMGFLVWMYFYSIISYRDTWVKYAVLIWACYHFYEIPDEVLTDNILGTISIWNSGHYFLIGSFLFVLIGYRKWRWNAIKSDEYNKEDVFVVAKSTNNVIGFAVSLGFLLPVNAFSLVYNGRQLSFNKKSRKLKERIFIYTDRYRFKKIEISVEDYLSYKKNKLTFNDSYHLLFNNCINTWNDLGRYTKKKFRVTKYFR